MISQILNQHYSSFTFHAVSVLLVGAAISVLGIYVLIRERVSGIGVKFWLFALCISTWLIALGVDYAGFQVSSSLWLHQIANVGIAFIPVTALTLTAAVVQRSQRLRRLIMSGIIISFLFSVAVIFSDMFIRELRRYPWGYYSQYGPLGALFILYFFGIMIFLLRLFWTEYRRSADERRRKRLKGLLLAFGIGYLGALDFLAAFGIPLFPFGYIPIFIFLVITAYVIVRYRLVDITPELAAGKILETMHGAVIVVDIEGRVRVVNRAASDMLGYDKSELFGRGILSVVDFPDRLRGHNLLRSGSIRDHEMIWADKNGRRFDVSVSASVLTDRRGFPAGVVYAAHDVTERKRAEEQLKKYSEELKKSNEDIMSFTHIVTHDLRAPLISIHGFSRDLKKTLDEITPIINDCLPHLGEPEQKKLRTLLHQDVNEALEFIGSSVSRMDKLINAVLALSRLDRKELRPEPINMKELTRSILYSLAHQIEQKRATVTMGDLPVVVYDRMSMEQVMGNLLDNAVKYLDPARDGEIDIACEEKADEAIFRIQDNGRGIAGVEVSKVFDLFRRAVGSDVPGEGVGLAHVKTLVRRHGGRIWCESEPGAGTTFFFTVPGKHYSAGIF